MSTAKDSKVSESSSTSKLRFNPKSKAKMEDGQNKRPQSKQKKTTFVKVTQAFLKVEVSKLQI